MSRLLVVAALCAGVASPALSNEAPPIGHNPFARPPSEVTRMDRGPLVVTESGEVTIQLTATMVGAAGRLANVAGRIIKPGDEVDGFVLTAVYEDRAVFERGGVERTVYVKPDLVEEDEQ